MFNSLVFICPKCQETRIEEVVSDAVVTSEIVIIHEDGELDYGDQIVDDGLVSRYQCLNCGFVIGGNEEGDSSIKDQLELVDWIKKNCTKE